MGARRHVNTLGNPGPFRYGATYESRPKIDMIPPSCTGGVHNKTGDRKLMFRSPALIFDPGRSLTN